MTQQKNFGFKSYSWVIGTTSFRVSELKYKIEKQLIKLKELREVFPNDNWKDLQIKYFDLLVEAGLSNNNLKGIDKREKDARQKTSPLRDLGFINDERKLTRIGNLLLDIVLNKNYQHDNIFGIRNDSFMYLKQFTKIEFSKNVSSNSYSSFKIKPFLALIYFLIKNNGSISKEIFTYILPTIKDNNELFETVEFLKKDKYIDIVKFLLYKMKGMENYKNALSYFLKNEKNDDTFKKVFLNMKGGKYDLPYKGFYNLFEKYNSNLSKQEKINLIKNINNYISKSLPDSLNKNTYYKLLFNTNKKLNNNDYNVKLINLFENKSFIFSYTDNFDENFFYLVHLGKWITNLEEYYDNNKRFFSLTDIFIFEKNKILLDEVAFVVFDEIIGDLIDDFSSSNEEYEDKLYNFDNTQIFNAINKNIILDKLKNKFSELEDEGNITEVIRKIKEKRKIERFNELIDENFSVEDISTLLNNIKERNDEKVKTYKNIGWEADLSTIFEYVIGVGWYIISGKKGDLSKYLNLDLDANLLPRRFAGGGQSDMIFNYNDHNLLIEVTLSNKDNQKKMELEPVSRHLGKYLLENGNNGHYLLFVASYLDPNVLVNFRAYKKLRYYNPSNPSKYVENLKIIPIDIDDFIKLLKSGKDYNYIQEEVFDESYDDNSYEDGYEWREYILKSKIAILNES